MITEVPKGCLTYEFTCDEILKPDVVNFSIYKRSGEGAEKVFGANMPMEEWQKFLAMANRFGMQVNEKIN